MVVEEKWKDGGIMAYVLTNGKYYIKMSDTGKTLKTDTIEEARVYLTTQKAKERLEKSPGKTKGYYIYDLVSKSKYRVSGGIVHKLLGKMV